MKVWFELNPPRELDGIRALFEVLASDVEGRPVKLSRVEHRGEQDLNGQGKCFVAKWADGAVTFDEQLINGDGNPRDYWSYQLTLTLTLPSLKLRGGGSDSAFREFSVDFEGTGAQWLTLRSALRRVLGEAADRSHDPWLARDVLPALVAEGKQETAVELARESLARSAQNAHFRDDIVAWLAANDPASADPAMRVREAPGAIEGWLELERSGATGLDEAFARLCPTEPARWKSAAPWFAHPAWPLQRVAAPTGEWKTIHLSADHVWPSFINSLSVKLTGWQVGTDWQEVVSERPEGIDGWHWRVSRRARVPDGERLPRVHVTLSGVRRKPEDWNLDWEKLFSLAFEETITWSWIGGPATGDAVLVVERALPQQPHAVPVQAAITFTVVGTDAFRQQAEAAVLELSGLKWYPVSPEDSLKPPTAKTEPFADARAALKAIVSPERFARAEVLLQCRCQQPAIGVCEHRAELLNYAREDFMMETAAASARNAAWNAAYYSVGSRPEPEPMQRNLAKAASEHARAAETLSPKRSG